MEVQTRRADGERLFLIDVRQPDEHQLTRIDGADLIPMETIPRRLSDLEEMAEENVLVVFCHHGCEARMWSTGCEVREWNRVRAWRAELTVGVSTSIPAYSDIYSAAPSLKAFLAESVKRIAMPFYKVMFTKRFNSEGEEADRPENFVEVLGRSRPERREAEVIEPAGMHSQEVMDEDDAFLSIGTEVWEYEVADGRQQEFIDALEQSRKR